MVEIQKCPLLTSSQWLAPSGRSASSSNTAVTDIGFGDALTPGPVQAVSPVLINDLPASRLSAYPVYTVVSEKVHAIALLGMANSRVKDYVDLWGCSNGN